MNNKMMGTKDYQFPEIDAATLLRYAGSDSSTGRPFARNSKSDLYARPCTIWVHWDSDKPRTNFSPSSEDPLDYRTNPNHIKEERNYRPVGAPRGSL